MPLPYSIEELITQNFETAINYVAEEAGYAGQLRVERLRRLGNTIESNTVILIDGQLSWHDQQSLGRDRYTKAYQVIIPVLDSQVATAEHQQQSTRLRADIYKALMADPYRGGFAMDTRFAGASSEIASEMPTETLDFEVHFFTAKDDPYEQ